MKVQNPIGFALERNYSIKAITFHLFKLATQFWDTERCLIINKIVNHSIQRIAMLRGTKMESSDLLFLVTLNYVNCVMINESDSASKA